MNGDGNDRDGEATEKGIENGENKSEHVTNQTENDDNIQHATDTKENGDNFENKEHVNQNCEKSENNENAGNQKENDDKTKNNENTPGQEIDLNKNGGKFKNRERGVDVDAYENKIASKENGGKFENKKKVDGENIGKTEKIGDDVRVEGGNFICGRAEPMWITRVRLDFKQKKFLPIKAMFFLLFGAMMALFPFLTLHARSLGITEKELSLLFALSPIIAFIGPPLTGILADRIGNFKILLSILMASSGAISMGYLAVPIARQKVPLPDQLTYILQFNQTEPIINLEAPHQCEYRENVKDFTLMISNCSFCDDFRVPDGNDTAEVEVLRSGSDQNKTTSVHITKLPSTITREGSVDGCVPVCMGFISSKNLCTNNSTMETFNPKATFFSYMAVRLLNGVTLATAHTMNQGAIMAILREYKGDLGLQRLYANLGAIIMTPISGVLIDVFSNKNGKQDFSPAFFLYFGLKVMGALVVLFMDLDFRMPSNKVTKDFKSLLKNPEVITFLVVMLITGAFFGLLDTFLFWLLQDLGAKKSLMGITVTVGTSAGIPILVASGYIINKLGHANTIIVGLAFYVVRMIGYSYLMNPWWCMPFEVLECFTVSLLSTAATAYADDLATPSTIATLQGTFGGLHHGVGRAIGSFIGGFLIAPLGIRVTFRIAAGVSAVTCLIYFIANRFFFRKQQQERKKARQMETLQNNQLYEENNIKKQYNNPGFEED